MAKTKIRLYLYEGFVIVASILIAFALDAIWANAQERRVEQRLLGELLAEFRQSERRIEASIAELEGVIGAGMVMLGHLGPNQPTLPTESAVELFGDMTALNTLEVPSSTLESIIAGGQLSLIENDELRKRLLEWPALFDDVRENHEWHREETDEFLVPAISPYVPVRNADFGFPAASYGPSRFEFDATDLQRNREFEGRLMNRISRQGATFSESRTLLQATTVLIELLESEID